MEFIIVFIVAIFISNVVLSQFLGIYPFLGVSERISAIIDMGAAVTFALLLTTVITWLVQTCILVLIGLEFLQTIALILVIATFVQMTEMVIKKISPALYRAFGIFLPLITTNCYVLGAAILVIRKEFTRARSLVYAVSIGIGFLLAMVIFAGIREQLARTDSTPRAMKNAPIALITAGILVMAFMGFSGLAVI